MHRVKLRDANITAANFTDSSLHHANLEPTDGKDAWRLADRSTEGVSEAPIAWKFKFPQGFFCRRKNGVEEHSSA